MGKRLIAWIDVEAAGETPELHSLLEFAGVLTDFHGEQVGDAYHSLIHAPHLSQLIEEASPRVKLMHSDSGLWEELWAHGGKHPHEVDREAVEWLEAVAGDSRVYMGGNSITLDRRFLIQNTPMLYEKISHQSVDVTSISLPLQERFHAPRFEKALDHRALPDVYDSIKEYRHYMAWLQKHLFRDTTPSVS